jgi:xylan 1,4-beta-xylosidase
MFIIAGILCHTNPMKKILILLFITLPLSFTIKAQTTYTNPIIPGFHPDPSVCRVNDDFYLVNSSFGYFPGVPIFHSKDLVNWKQIGYVLTRPEQLPIKNASLTTGGIYAPTIRYHAGTFYMVTTNISMLKNFYVTAKNPAGPWSDPIWIDIPTKYPVIDPTLYFDDDGKTYLITNPGDDTQGIILMEIDTKTGKLLSAPKTIWQGTGGRYPEGPHIYKKDNWYYLMIAEGGTEYGHKEMMARSRQLTGPYTPDPANPILTHINRNAEGNPIQGTGHADLVQAQDGSWWMVNLAFRPINSQHILGRETFLAPVKWEKGEWPVVNGNGTIQINMQAKTLPLHPYAEANPRDNFDADTLTYQWNFINDPVMENYRVKKGSGHLGLIGNDASQPLTFVGRRQEHFNFEASTLLEFNPQTPNEKAGLTVMMDKDYHLDLSIQQSDGKRYLSLIYYLGTLKHIEKQVPLADGPVELKVTGNEANYNFSFRQGTGDFSSLGSIATKFLSSEFVGGFTGVYLGMFANGNGQVSKTAANFDWFEYDHK